MAISGIKNKFIWGWLTLFLFTATRFYILLNPPREFTQITYVYMPYAHLWASGETPYLKQWYEYPPLTIPFFYLPHLIDMATNNRWYHVNYSDAYKTIVLLSDVGIFSLIWLALRRLKISQPVMYASLWYYAVSTAKANHFIYDSFDLLFIGPIVLSLAAPILWKNRGTFLSWLGFALAFGVKYVNAPLGLPLAVGQRFNWKKLTIEGFVAFLLIWILPLAIFRSSLLVTMEYHKQRGLQIESAPATLVRTINQWTRTEKVAEIAKAYDIQGPVSKQVKQVFDKVFPVSILLYVVFAGLYVLKLKRQLIDTEQIWVTLGFVTLFTATATVLSTPYLLWHIPLVAMVPTNSIRQKIWLIVPSFIVVAAGMTKIPDLPVGPLTIHILIGWVKAVGFTTIFIQVLLHMIFQLKATLRS